MGTTNPGYDLKRVRARLFAVLFGALFALVALGASPANAEYWTGSAGSGGGGGCSFSTGWNFSSSWPAAVANRHGCDNTVMNNAMGNQCIGRGDVLGVWWLGDNNSPGNYWTEFYDGPNDDPGVWQAAVRNMGSGMSDAGRNFVINGNSGQKTLLWLCAADDIQDYTPPEPTKSEPTCAARWGVVTIPNFNTSKATYRSAGQDRSPGENVNVDGSGITVTATAKPGFRFVGVGDPNTKTWSFNTPNPKPPSECFADVTTTIVHCDQQNPVSPNTGYVQITSMTQAGKYELVSQTVTRNSGDKIYGNDGTSVTINVRNLMDGWSIRFNGVQVSGSWTSSPVFNTCNNPNATATVDWTEPRCTALSPKTYAKGSYVNRGNNVTWGSSGNTAGDPGTSVTLTATATGSSKFISTPPGASLNAAKTVATFAHTWVTPADSTCPSGVSSNPPTYADCSPDASSGQATINGTGWSRPPGTYTYSSGTSVSFTGPGGATSSHTFPTNCSTTWTETVTETGTDTWCVNRSGTETSYSTSVQDSVPYPYSWRTVIEGDTPHAGPSVFTAVSATKQTPMGTLLANSIANNTKPTDAQVTTAMNQTNSVAHAAVSNINVDDNGNATQNGLFMAEGGVMNISEYTQYVMMRVTTITRQDTPWTACDTYSQDKYRTRTDTYTKTQNPTQYRVTYTTRSTRPAVAATPDTYTWDRYTRGTISGKHCTFAAHDAGEGNATGGLTHSNIGNCNKGKDNDYSWSAWGPWSYSNSGSNNTGCPGGGQPDVDIRNCQKTAGSPGSPAYDSGTQGPYTYADPTTTCPSSYSTTSGTTTTTYTYTCTAYPPTYTTTVSYGSWSGWTRYGPVTITEGTRNYGTPTYTIEGYSYETRGASTQLTAFYQSIATHCNAANFNTATNRSGVTYEDSGDASRNLSASATSPLQPVNSDGTVNRWWGMNASVSNPQGTNSLGFFDKECAYEGARVGTNQRAAYNLYRDNKLYDVSVDLYRPVASGVVSNTNRAALRTIVSRWDAGTPKPSGAAGATMQTYLANNQQVFKQNVDYGIPVLRNWGSTRNVPGPSWAFLDGEHTQLKVGGTWASDKAKPNVFSFKWEYDPTLSNQVPLTNVGFGVGSARSYTLGTVSANIRGIVYGRQDGANSPAEYSTLASNTGTGVSVNNMDAGLPKGVSLTSGMWNTRPHEYSPYYTTVTFIRSVGQ